jgi:hypothetical protein
MIVVRYTFRPSADWQTIVDMLVEWRDTHPGARQRIYNTISGKQKVVIVEQDFDDIDDAGRAMVPPYPDPPNPWAERWDAVDAMWDQREILRMH